MDCQVFYNNKIIIVNKLTKIKHLTDNVRICYSYIEVIEMALSRSGLHIDEEFGLQLKDFRNQYQIKAKDVAAYMGKSAAYISKLEKGEIHQIDKDEFVKMVNYISSSENGYQLFCERIIGTMNPNALERSTIANNFDWIDRILPIPEEYSNYIKKKIIENNISFEELADYINQNDDLDNKFLQEHKIDLVSAEKNIWMPYYEADSNTMRRNYIVVKISVEEIEDIVERRVNKTTYLYLYIILYHIYKLTELNKHLVLEESARTNIKRKTNNKLNELKIYTLSDKATAISQANNETELKTVLNSFDLKNQKLMTELISGIYYLSEQDVEYTNSKLEGVIANLKKDPSFSLAYMALPLDKIFALQPKVKRDFLDGVNDLIEKSVNVVKGELEKY